MWDRERKRWKKNLLKLSAIIIDFFFRILLYFILPNSVFVLFLICFSTNFVQIWHQHPTVCKTYAEFVPCDTWKKILLRFLVIPNRFFCCCFQPILMKIIRKKSVWIGWMMSRWFIHNRPKYNCNTWTYIYIDIEFPFIKIYLMPNWIPR